ncbi:MAG: hypothetical protein J6C59_11000 [Muribaculaceae bacterium]|nr:hypothetical protein [Muribaculaceae bacterium]
MKEKKAIRNLFDRFRPIITAKISNSGDKHVGPGEVQWVVPLTAGKTGILVTREWLAAIASAYPNIWYADLRIFPLSFSGRFDWRKETGISRCTTFRSGNSIAMDRH